MTEQKISHFTYAPELADQVRLAFSPVQWGKTESTVLWDPENARARLEEKGIKGVTVTPTFRR